MGMDKWLVWVVASCIAGCSRPDADGGPVVAAGAQPTAAVEAGFAGGDAAGDTLLPLTAAQLASVALPGELACVHAVDGATMLLARADVLADGEVRAVVNRDGTVALLGNTRAGGFNDLLDGITLSGDGLTIVVERHAGLPTGDESTSHAATLALREGDAAGRTYTGTWNCGP